MAAGLTGCGTSSGVADTSGTRLPGGGPRPLQAAFVFTADGALAPARVTIPRTDAVLLVVSAADRRAHRVTVDVEGRRIELELRPSETVRRRLTGLLSGATYRVVPDGAATDAALLRVE